MSRSTQLIVFGVIAAMALVTLGIIAWNWDAYGEPGAFSDRKLMGHTLVLVFMPVWLGLGALSMKWMLTRPTLQLADDSRRAAEVSLVSAALLCAGVHLWGAASAVIGEPPGREFGVRLLEAIAGIYFILNANFSAKTSPPQGWPDPGGWIRATLRTGWVGVPAGVVILVGAIAAPVESMIWIVGAATLAYVAAAVLNHLKFRRKPA